VKIANNYSEVTTFPVYLKLFDMDIGAEKLYV